MIVSPSWISRVWLPVSAAPQAMGKVSYVQKSKGGGLQYSVVTHDAVTAKVRPALLEAGIVYFPQQMEHHHHHRDRASCGPPCSVDSPPPRASGQAWGGSFEGPGAERGNRTACKK